MSIVQKRLTGNIGYRLDAFYHLILQVETEMVANIPSSPKGLSLGYRDATYAEYLTLIATGRDPNKLAVSVLNPQDDWLTKAVDHRKAFLSNKVILLVEVYESLLTYQVAGYRAAVQSDMMNPLGEIIYA